MKLCKKKQIRKVSKESLVDIVADGKEDMKKIVDSHFDEED